MPKEARTLGILHRYHDALERTARRTAFLVTQRLQDVARAELSSGFRNFVAEGAELITLGQEHAAALSRGAIRAMGRSELGEALDAGASEENVGFTADGRELTRGLAATPAKVYVAVRQGRPLGRALAYGRFSATRFALTEVFDAARIELGHQMSELPGIRGWRWASRGTCSACMSLDDGRTRGVGQSMPAHPYCRCIQEPVFHVREIVRRPDGRDRFGKLSQEQQDEVMGPERAELLRTGRVEWTELVKVEEHVKWRASITERPVRELVEGGSRADQ